MTALILSTLLASLLGSFHCAGMCGAFLAVAVGGAPGAAKPSRMERAKTQCAYHGGRGVTYVLLGVAAGSAGALVNLGSTLAGLQPIAAMLAGGVMVWFGVSLLLRHAGVRLRRMPVPAFMQKTVHRGYGAAMALPPVVRAGMIGLLTTLLPCGWLYAFAVVAAGTASPLTGGVVMAAFWLGTLPLLAALGAGIQAGLGAFGSKLPVMTSVLMIGVGLYTLTGRSMLSSAKLIAAVPDVNKTPACCVEETHP